MTRLPAPVKLTVSQKRSIEIMEKEYSETGRHRWADQCKAILLLAEGYDMEETSSFLKRPYSTVQQWSRRFRRKGLRGLKPNTSNRGRKKKLVKSDGSAVIGVTGLLAIRSEGRAIGEEPAEDLDCIGDGHAFATGIRIASNEHGPLGRRLNRQLDIVEGDPTRERVIIRVFQRGQPDLEG